jgi:hypothetical protein
MEVNHDIDINTALNSGKYMGIVVSHEEISPIQLQRSSTYESWTK